MASNPPRCWRIAHSESSTGWGGQEHRILAELAGFRKRGSQVSLLAPPDAQLFQRASATQITVVPLSLRRFRFPLAVLQVARWLRRQNVEIVNTHSSRDGWIVGLAGRLVGVPFIVRTRHFDVAVPNRWLSRLVYAHLADHVITTSPKVTAHFQQLFRLPAERFSTVPTGIDLEQFSPQGPIADLAPAARQAHLPLIGMVCVVRKAKGHETLLQAMRRLCDAGSPVHCVFVGDGPYRAAVEQRVQELHLTERVTWTGHREDIPEVLRALDVLVLPSLHEGIPQIGLQALAVGTPVIGSDAGGIPSIVQPGETGRVFPAGDAEALATTIRETLEQREATQALAERGRLFVSAHYSLDGMLATLETLYRRHLPG
jgi:glycosyltransferase involved in cell wall biosynthesis